MNATALLQVRELGRCFELPRSAPWARPQALQALSGVSFALQAGRSLGIVGESGSGKSTLARLVMALDAPTQGQVLFRGQDLHALPAAQLRALRADFQMVFQDPYGSLDPRQTVAQIVTEPLQVLPDRVAGGRLTKAQLREHAQQEAVPGDDGRTGHQAAFSRSRWSQLAGSGPVRVTSSDSTPARRSAAPAWPTASANSRRPSPRRTG